MDGANGGVVSFLLCVNFELDALALTVEWSSWATCHVAIASKSPKLNPGPTLIAKGCVMRVGEEVRGGT